MAHARAFHPEAYHPWLPFYYFGGQLVLIPEVNRSADNYLERHGVIKTRRYPVPRLDFVGMKIHDIPLENSQLDPALTQDAAGDPPPDGSSIGPWLPPQAATYLERHGIVKMRRPPSPRLDFTGMKIHEIPLDQSQIDPSLMQDAAGDPPPDRGKLDPWPPLQEVDL